MIEEQQKKYQAEVLAKKQYIEQLQARSKIDREEKAKERPKDSVAR